VLGFYALVGLLTALIHYTFVVKAGWLDQVFWTSSEIVIAGLVTTVICVRAGWTTWWGAGWPDVRPSCRGFGLGLCVGLAMAATVLMLEIVTGQGAVLLRRAALGEYLAAIIILVGVLAVAALSEEILFRGFPLTRLSGVMGRFRASLLLASGFTALHLANPAVTILGLVNIFLASLLLSAVFFRFGGLPAAWGAHLGWNAGLAATVDAPVSGISFDLPGVDFSTGGPTWVAGGHFGPEGGIIATLVMGVTLVLLGKGVFTAAPGAPPIKGLGAGGWGQ